jgi:hypothetical protein
MSLNTVEEDRVETAETQDANGNDGTKLVPMVESIRYRKRAQSAEKQAETLTEQLAEADRKIAQMSQELSNLQVERQLTQKLVAAGVIDLEAAVLVASARLEGYGQAGIDDCVAQLRKEKPYLFPAPPEASAFRKTAGAKDRAKQTRTALEQAAKQAARTGNRADLQHYLKLRRSLL